VAIVQIRILLPIKSWTFWYIERLPTLSYAGVTYFQKWSGSLAHPVETPLQDLAAILCHKTWSEADDNYSVAQRRAVKVKASVRQRVEQAWTGSDPEHLSKRMRKCWTDRVVDVDVHVAAGETVNELVDITRPRRAQKHSFIVSLSVKHTHTQRCQYQSLRAGLNDTQTDTPVLYGIQSQSQHAYVALKPYRSSLARQNSDSVDRRQRWFWLASTPQVCLTVTTVTLWTEILKLIKPTVYC